MKIASQNFYKEYLFTLSILIPTLTLFFILKGFLTSSDHQDASRIIGLDIPNDVELVEVYGRSPSFFGEGTDYFIFQFAAEQLEKFKENLNWPSFPTADKELEEKLSFDFWKGEKCKFQETTLKAVYYLHSRNEERPFDNYSAAILDLTTGCLYIKIVDT